MTTTATVPGGDPPAHPDPGLLHPVVAGVVASLVGFASTFALVLAGLRAVGASPEQASSGLLALCISMGVTGIWLTLRNRMPISLAWSTPGAALLISSGQPDGGYKAALGAFLVCGLLIIASGLWRPLGRILAAIPVTIASAMLAGVLLPVCIAPVRALVSFPAMAAPGIVVWIVVGRVSRRWAVPAALLATAIAIAIDPADTSRSGAHAAPSLTFTLPAFNLSAIVGLAVPLFIVTMASQNVPGMTVLSTYGYRPPLRPILASTGAATAVGSFFGAHAVNLAAITAALVAGPDSHPDPSRRWVASLSSNGLYIVLGLCAGLATVLVSAAPPVVIEAVAGLALLGALAAALRAALAVETEREAAVVTFVVTASAITVLSIGAPFWGLLAGIALLAITRRDARSDR